MLVQQQIVVERQLFMYVLSLPFPRAHRTARHEAALSMHDPLASDHDRRDVLPGEKDEQVRHQGTARAQSRSAIPCHGDCWGKGR